MRKESEFESNNIKKSYCAEGFFKDLFLAFKPLFDGTGKKGKRE